MRIETITNGDKKDVFAVRKQVFVDEQGVPEDLELDEYDEGAIHFLAKVDGRPVGAARMRWIDDHTVKAERVAVLSSYRGSGVGRAIMQKLEQYAKAHHARAVELHAQQTARPFYERLHYEAFGEPFLDAGMAHIVMRKVL